MSNLLKPRSLPPLLPFLYSELADQTKDITERFQSERRPQPAGLDQALGYGSQQQRQRSTQLPPSEKYAARGGGFVTGKEDGVAMRGGNFAMTREERSWFDQKRLLTNGQLFFSCVRFRSAVQGGNRQEGKPCSTFWSLCSFCIYHYHHYKQEHG